MNYFDELRNFSEMVDNVVRHHIVVIVAVELAIVCLC